MRTMQCVAPVDHRVTRERPFRVGADEQLREFAVGAAVRGDGSSQRASQVSSAGAVFRVVPPAVESPDAADPLVDDGTGLL